MRRYICLRPTCRSDAASGGLTEPVQGTVRSYTCPPIIRFTVTNVPSIVDIVFVAIAGYSDKKQTIIFQLGRGKLQMTKTPEEEEAQLLDLFFERAYLLFTEQGRTYKDRLKALIAERQRSFGQDAQKRLVHLFTLVMRCPFLLSKPEGFEWVLEEYIDVHRFSRLSIRWGLRSHSYGGTYHHVDKEVFREAWHIAWGELNKGRPNKPLSNYGIAQEVEELMVFEGCTLPEAVKKVARDRSRNRKDGREVEVEEATIYRSLREVAKRERRSIPMEEVFYPGAGLIKPTYTDLRTPKQKQAREEMLKERARGFPQRKV
jgi:hypothetical protein